LETIKIVFVKGIEKSLIFRRVPPIFKILWIVSCKTAVKVKTISNDEISFLLNIEFVLAKTCST
jgi:hypothetical protein